MNELLFFVMIVSVVGLSYYLGFKNGFSKNIKLEVKQFLHDLTVSKMAHDHFMIKAQKEAVIFLKHLGLKDIKDYKEVKIPKLPNSRQFDKDN